MHSGELVDQDGREKALCAARFMASADWDIKPAREFYAAGIPVETAAAVYQSGGGPQQTAAVRGDAITAPLAGWYL